MAAAEAAAAEGSGGSRGHGALIKCHGWKKKKILKVVKGGKGGEKEKKGGTDAR